VSNGTHNVDATQIAFITNQKTLIAACDSLQAPDFNNPKDKSPASLHAKYSRIKINVTDFSKTPTVFMCFYLQPQEICALYDDAKKVKGTAQEYKWGSQKKKEQGGKTTAEAITVARNPYRDAEKTVVSNYPWTIKISHGTYPNGPNDKPNYDKNAYKMLSDVEFVGFLCSIVRYMSAWEVVMGAPIIKRIDAIKKARHDNRDGAAPPHNTAPQPANAPAGSNAPPNDFDDEPL
jgi:hypothetical protein